MLKSEIKYYLMTLKACVIELWKFNLFQITNNKIAKREMKES